MSDVHVFIATRTTGDIVVPARAGNQDEFNRRIAAVLAMINGGHLHAGNLKLRPTPDPLQDHLLCDGSAISREQFPELFAYLGTSQGEGDGVETFNLPDYRDGSLAVPMDAPTQVITEGGTVSNDEQVPTPPANVGQPRGGNVVTGGRRQRLVQR